MKRRRQRPDAPAQCLDCQPRIGSRACPECKAERRRLDALHDRFHRESPPADRLMRALRVALYAAIVAAGGRLFE